MGNLYWKSLRTCTHGMHVQMGGSDYKCMQGCGFVSYSYLISKETVVE